MQIIGSRKRKLAYLELGAVPTVLALLDSPNVALQQQSMDCVGRWPPAGARTVQALDSTGVHACLCMRWQPQP